MCDDSSVFWITDSAKTSPISGTPPITKMDFFGTQNRKKCEKILSISKDIRYAGVFNEYGSCIFFIIFNRIIIDH